MKKINKLMLAIAAVALLATACGNKGVSNDPKAVVVAFMERLAKKDIDGAAKYATKSSESTLNMMKKALDAAEKMKDELPKGEEDPTEDFKDVEIGEAKINGDNATVPVTNKKKSETNEIPLVKENGEWKVDFSMNTLMKMGQEKGGMDMMDESGNDTINAEDFERNMKAADSLLKNIDPEKLKEMQKQMEKLQNNQN